MFLINFVLSRNCALCAVSLYIKLTGEASLRRARLAVQHGIYGVQAARTEAVVVTLVPAGRAGKHYKIAVFAAWRALFWIVLEARGQRGITSVPQSFV